MLPERACNPLCESVDPESLVPGPCVPVPGSSWKKTEAKLDKLTTGYLLRSKKLKEEADKLLKAKEDQAMALSTYAYMHAYEQAATPQRLKNLSDLCETQAARESMLQKRFADLVARTKAQ